MPLSRRRWFAGVSNHVLPTSQVGPVVRRRRTASYVVSFQHQENAVGTTKRERWTEAEVLALPDGEHDYFDRKSGQILSSDRFRQQLSKVLSAFANSGGGHLLIGVSDDGAFDGVDPIRGRTPTRQWLEQVIPELLKYSLKDFRVHEVEPSAPSAIPSDKVLIVVDVGDSSLAPHQATDGVYYQRAGSHSIAASHFYLETLRNRLVTPILIAKPLKVIHLAVFLNRNLHLAMQLTLPFTIKNDGRVAAYNTFLVVELNGYRKPFANDSELLLGGRPVGSPLLPTLSSDVSVALSLEFASPTELDALCVQSEIDRTLGPCPTFRYRVITETSVGEDVEISCWDLLDRRMLLDAVFAGFEKQWDTLRPAAR